MLRSDSEGFTAAVDPSILYLDKYLHGMTCKLLVGRASCACECIANLDYGSI